jgi:hypothetical protein
MRVAGAARLDPEFGGTGYILTASVAALGGYAFASMRYAPRIADLAQRIESTERSLSGQGRAIDELSDALRSLLAELDGAANTPSQREAIAAAQWVLTNRQAP